MANIPVIKGLNGSVTALAYSPDGKTVAAADGGFDLTLWDVSSGKSERKIAGLANGTGRVCWSPDGKTVYGTSGNDLLAWNAATGKEKLKIKGEMTGTAPSLIALSRDGKIIAATGRGRLKLWKTTDGTVLGEYEPHPNYGINWVAFSPDGRHVVTAAADRKAQLTATADGAQIETYTCMGRVLAAEFSPDGKTLFLADQTQTLHQIKVATGTDEPAPPLTRDAVRIAVSPDGQLVACAAATLQLWSRKEKQWHARPFTDSSVGATAVEFSPDGKTLACGDAEGRIHFWSTKELLGAK